MEQFLVNCGHQEAVETFSKQGIETELTEVCDFMGHAEKVHREYYRKHRIERQVVEVTNVQGNSTMNNQRNNLIDTNVRKRKASPSDVQTKEKHDEAANSKQQ